MTPGRYLSFFQMSSPEFNFLMENNDKSQARE